MENEKVKEHTRMCKEIEVGPDEIEGYKNQGFELKLARMYKEADVHPDKLEAYEKDGFHPVGEPLEKEGEHKHNKGTTPGKK